MGPLTVIAVGLVLAAVDIRTERLDLLVDPVGWALVAVGAWRLSARPAAVLAAATAVLSIADVALPHQWELMPIADGALTPGEAAVARAEQLVFLHVGGWRLAALALTAVGAGATLWVLLGRLHRRAEAAGQRRTATHLRALRWVVPGMWVVPYLVGMAAGALSTCGTFDPIWNGAAEYVGLAGLVAVAWLVVTFVREAGERWAASGGPRPSPWAMLAHQQDERLP